MQIEKRARSLRAWILVLTPIMLLAGLLLPGALMLYRAFATTHPDIAQMSRITSLQFPKTSRLVGSVMYGGQDHLLQAAVAVNREDLVSFVSGLKAAYDVDSGSDIANRQDRRHPRWWDPDSARRSLTFSGVPRATTRANSIDVVINLDNAPDVVIYLEWSGKSP